MLYIVCKQIKIFLITFVWWHETLSDAATERSHSFLFEDRGTFLNWGLTVGYWLSSEPWTPQSPHHSLAISVWSIVVVPLYQGDWPSTCRNIEQNRYTYCTSVSVETIKCFIISESRSFCLEKGHVLWNVI